MAADNFARVLAMKAVGELVDVDRIIQELTDLIGDIESYDLDTLFGRVNQNTENIEIINGDETVENSTYWKIANTDFVVKAELNNVTGNWEFTNNDGTVTLMPDYKEFVGTSSEWTVLPLVEKVKFSVANFTDK